MAELKEQKAKDEKFSVVCSALEFLLLVSCIGESEWKCERVSKCDEIEKEEVRRNGYRAGAEAGAGAEAEGDV